MVSLSFNRGFSLIEIIVYLALLVLLTAVGISSILSFTDTFTRYRAEKQLTLQVRSALERMVADVRNATAVDVVTSSLGTSPGTLELLAVGTSQTYTLTDGAITVAIDGGTASGLTGEGITIDSLTFYHYPSVTTELVRVAVTASATAGDTTVTETYYTSAVLRGSYE